MSKATDKALSGIPAQPFSAGAVLSLGGGILAARLGMSPVQTVAVGVGIEFLRDPGDEDGRTQMIYELTTYLVGYAVGLALPPGL